MTSRRMIFIESNTSGTGRLFALTARNLGLEPVVLTKDPGKYGYLASERIEHVTVDTDDAESVYRVCSGWSERHPIAGITSSSEYYIEVAARLAKRLGLRAPPPDAVAVCRYKPAQRERLRNGSILCPQGRVGEDAKACQLAAAQIGYPVVLKPPDRSGSEGVRYCATPTDVAQHSAYLFGSATTPDARKGCRCVLVEAFVDGPEYSVEIVSGRIVGITRKHLSGLPYFVEVGHDFPAPLDPSRADQIGSAALAAVRTLGLADWISHVEIRLTPSGPMIIEVNPRLAGGFIPELIRLATGIDLIGSTIRWSIGGDDVVPTLNKGRAASIRFLRPSRPGVLATVSGLDAARSTPGVADVTLYRTRGDRLSICGDFRDRIGHVIACDEELELAIHAAQEAVGAIQIDVEEAADNE